MFSAMSISMARTVTIGMTVSIAIIDFMLQDKLEKVWFFQETFLLADTSLILGMPFLTLSNALAEGELVWRTYISADTLLLKDSVRKRFVSWGMSGPDMLRWHLGIDSTFTDDSSKSLAEWLHHLSRCWKLQGVLSLQQDSGRAESGLVVMAVMMVVMMMNIYLKA